MKKWLTLFLIIVLLIIAAAYFFVPRTISIQAGKSMHVNARAFSRAFMNEDSWQKWWPGKMMSAGTHPRFQFNDHEFSIVDEHINGFVILVSEKNIADTTKLELLPIGPDSVELEWNGKVTASGLISRISNWSRSKQMSRELKLILDKAAEFYSTQDNLYGIMIKEDKVVDSTLLQNFAIARGYPPTEFIYHLIDELKRYAAKHDAKQTGLPMLNINTEDSVSYFVKVAIPVDKKLPTSGNITYKWMLGGGNILVADVKGGPATIRNAFRDMEDYMSDHHRLSPAIPFQSLVTDRLHETDTSKWITKVYYPVMW